HITTRCIEGRRISHDPPKDGNLNGAGGHAWLGVAIVEPHEFAQILREAVHVTPLQIPVADVTGKHSRRHIFESLHELWTNVERDFAAGVGCVMCVALLRQARPRKAANAGRLLVQQLHVHRDSAHRERDAHVPHHSGPPSRWAIVMAKMRAQSTISEIATDSSGRWALCAM